MSNKRTFSVNKNDTEKWKEDVFKSVKCYNDWFMNFAPTTYVQARKEAIARVNDVLQTTHYFSTLTSQLLVEVPKSLGILRMSTTPPLAIDRLSGLADVPRSFIKKMEQGKVSSSMNKQTVALNLDNLLSVVSKLLDREIMPWLNRNELPSSKERILAASVIADRLCGTLADPIIRNEQERRQLENINLYLTSKGYNYVETKDIDRVEDMQPGTFSYHFNVPVTVGETKKVNMPIDVVLKRRNAKKNEMPILIECKSAGDFTNTNKRRKEEATKIEQLRNTYGMDVEFVLFLCGYFDTGYLGYEAAEGIDWIWEHRIADFDKLAI